MAKKPKSQILEQDLSIDRDASEPAYFQLVKIIRGNMADGVLRPGDQLPSETQLCERYDLSPMTVRRAINILVDQGVVVAQHGRGVFVKPMAMSSAIFQLTDLQDLFKSSAHSTVQLLESRIVSADERVAGKLAIPVGTRTIFIRRLLRYDPTLALYHREYLVYDPTRPVVEADLEVTELQSLFTTNGEKLLKHGQITVESKLLSAEEAQILEIEPPAAGFGFEHLFYDYDEKPISWGWLIGRADRIRFTSQVGLKT
jgi:DNA-binding GntR family transcriptional regulator